LARQSSSDRPNLDGSLPGQGIRVQISGDETQPAQSKQKPPKVSPQGSQDTFTITNGWLSMKMAAPEKLCTKIGAPDRATMPPCS